MSLIEDHVAFPYIGNSEDAIDRFSALVSGLAHPARQPLSEISRRSPDFVDGCRVRLGNSEHWAIRPAGVAVRRPIFGPDGLIGFGPATSEPADDYLPDLVREMLDSRGMDQVRQAAWIVGLRLMTNYWLDADDLAALLPFVTTADGSHEETNRSLWSNALFAVAGIENFSFSW